MFPKKIIHKPGHCIEILKIFAFVTLKFCVLYSNVTQEALKLPAIQLHFPQNVKILRKLECIHALWLFGYSTVCVECFRFSANLHGATIKACESIIRHHQHQQQISISQKYVWNNCAKWKSSSQQLKNYGFVCSIFSVLVFCISVYGVRLRVLKKKEYRLSGPFHFGKFVALWFSFCWFLDWMGLLVLVLLLLCCFISLFGFHFILVRRWAFRLCLWVMTFRIFPKWNQHVWTMDKGWGQRRVSENFSAIRAHQSIIWWALRLNGADVRYLLFIGCLDCVCIKVIGYLTVCSAFSGFSYHIRWYSLLLNSVFCYICLFSSSFFFTVRLISRSRFRVFCTSMLIRSSDV